MKNYILAFFAVIVVTTCAAQTSFNSFYSENKHDCEFSISTPAFVANLFIPNEDVKEFETLLKKVKHYRVMIFSEGSRSLNKKFNRFIKQHKYTSIFRLNEKGEQVELYFLQKKNKIRELVLKVKSDEDFVLLGLKSNISEEDFNKIIDESNVKLTSN